MALIECHECGNQVSTEAAACPGCGATPRPSLKPKTLDEPKLDQQAKGVGAFGIFVLVFIVLGLILTMLPRSEPSSSGAAPLQTSEKIAEATAPAPVAALASTKPLDGISDTPYRVGHPGLICEDAKSLTDAYGYAAEKNDGAMMTMITDSRCHFIETGMRLRMIKRDIISRVAVGSAGLEMFGYMTLNSIDDAATGKPLLDLDNPSSAAGDIATSSADANSR